MPQSALAGPLGSPASAEELFRGVFEFGYRYLRAFGDPFTRSQAEDLAAEVVVACWQGYHRGSLRRIHPGLIKVIARRTRYGWLQRNGQVCRDPSVELGDLSAPAQASRLTRVAGHWVERELLCEAMVAALTTLPPIQAQLLRDFYSGHSCAELAAPSRASAQSIRSRLVRARRALGQRLERLVHPETGELRSVGSDSCSTTL